MKSSDVCTAEKVHPTKNLLYLLDDVTKNMTNFLRNTDTWIQVHVYVSTVAGFDVEYWNLRNLRFEIKRQAAHSVDELHFDCFHLADRLKHSQNRQPGMLEQEKWGVAKTRASLKRGHLDDKRWDKGSPDSEACASNQCLYTRVGTNTIFSGCSWCGASSDKSEFTGAETQTEMELGRWNCHVARH